MVKPASFDEPFVALCNIPYLYNDSSGGLSTAYGGVLRRGQIVWLIGNDKPLGRPAKAKTAFVDHLGVISVDPHWLVRWRPEAVREGRPVQVRGVA